MSTKIVTFTAHGRLDGLNTIWLNPILKSGKYSLKTWNGMIELLSLYSTKWEMLVKPHGVCIRSTSTERVISPRLGVGLTCAPVLFQSAFPIGTLLTLRGLSNTMKIGLALWNSSKMDMFTILGIRSEISTCPEDLVLQCSVTISQTTENISVRIEFLR